MNSYKALNKQVFAIDEYSIVPIRFEDRYDIMIWRNEQMYHLRQNKHLTHQEQDIYFENVISKLFKTDEPDQILFSFLKNDVCIGYGGLVHINWVDKNAEISFIMGTEFEQYHFNKFWNIFLKLIEKVAFNELNMHKIYTYAYDLRPHLYPIFELAGFNKNAILQDHVSFDNKYINVIIHEKINNYG